MVATRHVLALRALSILCSFFYIKPFYATHQVNTQSGPALMHTILCSLALALAGPPRLSADIRTYVSTHMIFQVISNDMYINIPAWL